jgi:PilZ domain
MNQRQSERTALQTTSVAIVDVESGVSFVGDGQDVSDTGLSLTCQLEPPVGADMHVTLSGQSSLSAQLRVTRVAVDPEGFRVAGSLSRIG